MQILKQTEKETRKTELLAILLNVMNVLAECIMYYAAALTLNTLFAGIGNMYVSLIALLTSLGAAAGKFLFTYLKEGIDSELRERFIEAFDESLIMKEENDEERVNDLIKDAVHYETEGRMSFINLLLSDLIRCIALCMISWKCGLILSAGIVICDYLFLHLARRNIRDIRTFHLQLCLYPSALFAILSSSVLLWAVSMMKNGRLGLYGLILMALIMMAIAHDHIRETRKVPQLRRDLKSIEILDSYKDSEEFTLPQAVHTEPAKPSKNAYLLHISAMILFTLCAVFFAQKVLGILSYRTMLSEKASAVLFPLCALCSACLYAFGEKETVQSADRNKVMKISCAVVSVMAFAYVFALNPLTAGIYGSWMAALQLALPLFLRMRAEKGEEDESVLIHTESFHGLVNFLFIIIFIGAGVLLYWNAMASFADVWMIFLIAMSIHSYIDKEPFHNMIKEEEYDESAE